MNTYFMQKPRLFAASLGVVALALLPSCQDEDFGYTTDEIRLDAYNRNFKEVFGEVDPDHNWSTASQLNLSVKVGFEGEYTVKVYTANPRYPENNAYLVGQYDNISAGEHNFLCDLPATIECAYVGLIDGEGNRMILPAQIAMNKASVEFGANAQTRTVYSGSTPFTYRASDNKVVTTIDDIRTPLSTLPEQVNNTGKVSQNFEYVSMGAFDISPIYSITSNRGGVYDYSMSNDDKNACFGERLGIYTYNQQGQLVKDGSGNIVVTWIWHMNRGVLDNNMTAVTSGTWYEAHKTGEAADSWHQMYWFENNINGSDEEREAREQFCVWKGSNFKDGYDKIRTDGIHLDIPSGTRFGFVLDTDHGNVFSNSSYNIDAGSPSGNTLDHIKDTYAATFHTNNTLYLAFEDWDYANEWHDNDFNDLVLKLVPSNGSYNPLIIDKDSEVDPIIYIVACEDLGGTFDWDFNDVVFGIEHVSGQDKARIKLLAAGGTLPISLIYENNGTANEILFDNLKDSNGNTTDLHAALDAETTQPVNVNATGGISHDPVYSKEFPVGRYDFTVLDDAAKFKIKVVYGANNVQKDVHVPDYDEKQKIPQAFLIADPKWEWPTEHERITSKYPEFETWVTNWRNGQNWTHTIWGNVREFNTIPSGASNLFSFNDAVTYNGNVATIVLSKDDDKMSRNSNYKLAIMLAEEANAEFWYQVNGQTTKIDVAPNGMVQSEKLTTFSISSDIVNLIKNSDQNGKLTLTFGDGVQAQGKVLLANWYKVGTLLDSKLEVKSPITIDLNATAALVYTTENQESPVTFSSSDNTTVAVDENGNVTGRAVGTATITLHQAASEHYAAADNTIEVIVRNSYRLHFVPQHDPGNGGEYLYDLAGKCHLNITRNGTTVQDELYVEIGDVLSLTPVPCDGYRFVQWWAGYSEVPRSYTVEASDTKDIPIFGVFQEKSYTVTLHPDIGCIAYITKVDGEDVAGKTTTSGTYKHGTILTLKAEAKDGYTFVKWSSGDTSAERTLIVEADANPYATSERTKYNLTMSAPSTEDMADPYGRDVNGERIFFIANQYLPKWTKVSSSAVGYQLSSALSQGKSLRFIMDFNGEGRGYSPYAAVLGSKAYNNNGVSTSDHAFTLMSENKVGENCTFENNILTFVMTKEQFDSYFMRVVNNNPTTLSDMYFGFWNFLPASIKVQVVD